MMMCFRLDRKIGHRPHLKCVYCKQTIVRDSIKFGCCRWCWLLLVQPTLYCNRNGQPKHGQRPLRQYTRAHTHTQICIYLYKIIYGPTVPTIYIISQMPFYTNAYKYAPPVSTSCRLKYIFSDKCDSNVYVFVRRGPRTRGQKQPKNAIDDGPNKGWQQGDNPIGGEEV